MPGNLRWVRSFEVNSFRLHVICRCTSYNMKMTVFWDVARCSLRQRPDDRISKHLWNVGQFLRVIFVLAAVRTWNLNKLQHPQFLLMTNPNFIFIYKRRITFQAITKHTFPQRIDFIWIVGLPVMKLHAGFSETSECRLITLFSAHGQKRTSYWSTQSLLNRSSISIS
jgi:hypothetical protein